MSIDQFVGRELELKRLSGFHEKACAGSSQSCFILGNAGAGKSCLLGEFARQLGEKSAETVVLTSQCNSQSGMSDPYLPFLGLLEQMTALGEEEAETEPERDKFSKLQSVAAKTLVGYAPDLLGLFIPFSSLFVKVACTAAKSTGWFERFEQKAEEAKTNTELDQDRLFQQYTGFLKEVAKDFPLVLIVDDLQWVDAASIQLLFYLATHLDSAPILLIGTYRPNDVALGRGGERHPLEPIVSECKRISGDITIDLNAVAADEKKALVTAMLDSEPNVFGVEFRDSLFSHTSGNPLFTRELLRVLQERGSLVKDSEGRWGVQGELDWGILPARVEGVIEERIGRLREELRDVLTVASVEGELFTVQILAEIQKMNGRALLKLLSRELDKQHSLVAEVATERVGRSLISRFGFNHILVQQYLYNDLSESERIILHGEVGEVLEKVYKDQLEVVLAKLAHHFAQSGDVDKALDYIDKAARRALRISAYDEAQLHLRAGLRCLEELPRDKLTVEQILGFKIDLTTALRATKGWADPEVVSLYEDIRNLSDECGAPAKRAPALFGLWTEQLFEPNFENARALGEECLQLGNDLDDKDIKTQALVALGNTCYWMGQLQQSHDYMVQAKELFGTDMDSIDVVDYGHHPLTLAQMFSIVSASLLGRLDEALKDRAELVEFSEGLEHPFNLALAIYTSAWLDWNIRHPDSCLENAERLIALSTENQFPMYVGLGMMYRGWALAMRGQAAQGRADIKSGFHDYLHVEGKDLTYSMYSLMMSEAIWRDGDVSGALDELDRGIAYVERSEEACYLPGLLQMKAEIAGEQSGSPADADAGLRQAMKTAEDHSSTLLQLRAANALARLSGDGEGRDLVAEILSHITSSPEVDALQLDDLEQARAIVAG